MMQGLAGADPKILRVVIQKLVPAEPYFYFSPLTKAKLLTLEGLAGADPKILRVVKLKPVTS